MTQLVAWWKSNPKVRFAARTIAVAVAAYVVNAILAGGFTDARSFAIGALTAGATATAGLLGLEPFVGVKAKVDVPADQSIVKEI
jgi:hypothetical protein